MKKLLAFVLLIATCFSLLVSCDTTPKSAMDLWQKTKQTMNKLSSYREDSTMRIKVNVEGVNVSVSSSGYVITDDSAKNAYYYEYSEASTSYNGSSPETSKELLAYNNGKMYVSNESDGNENALCSEISSKEFTDLMEYCSSGWDLSPTQFETLDFESSDGYGWILSFSDAKSELIDEIYSSEGLALLGMPKPSDIIVTFRINENFHATTTDIDLEFRDQNTEFSVRSRYSQYNSVNKKPIYDEDYEKVDDLRPMLLLSHKISTALTEEEGKFTLNVRDEIQGRFTSEYDAYTERDTVIFKNTENGFEYDVTAMLDNEYYRIVFEDGRQTVTNSNNESSTISSSEAHAFVFILGLLDSANFNETEVKNITALPFDQYEFTCETNDKSYFVELIEALDDTYVNHTMQITVTIKDGEIEEINSVIKITGRNYIRTVKTGVKFSEIDK